MQGPFGRSGDDARLDNAVSGRRSSIKSLMGVASGFGSAFGCDTALGFAFTAIFRRDCLLPAPCACRYCRKVGSLTGNPLSVRNAASAAKPTPSARALSRASFTLSNRSLALLRRCSFPLADRLRSFSLTLSKSSRASISLQFGFCFMVKVSRLLTPRNRPRIRFPCGKGVGVLPSFPISLAFQNALEMRSIRIGYAILFELVRRPVMSFSR